MRIQRVTDIPHGAVAYICRQAGHAPVVYVDASLTEAQVAMLAQRLSADPELLAMYGTVSV